MAYDEELAGRIRDLLDGEPGLAEKKMFGGLAFLVHGNMAVAASNEGGLLLRTDPDETEQHLAHPHTDPFVMRGREMAGWMRVVPEGLGTDVELRRWVNVGVTYARSLPPKQ
jgi:hypothetical protein